MHTPKGLCRKLSMMVDMRRWVSLARSAALCLNKCLFSDFRQVSVMALMACGHRDEASFSHQLLVKLKFNYSVQITKAEVCQHSFTYLLKLLLCMHTHDMPVYVCVRVCEGQRSTLSVVSQIISMLLF